MPTLRNNAPGPRGLPGMVGGIEPGEQLTITDEQFQAAMERPAFAGLLESGDLSLVDGEPHEVPEVPESTPEPPAPPEELPPVPGDGAPGAPPAPLSLKRK